MELTYSKIVETFSPESCSIFTENLTRMIHIDDMFYSTVAQRLLNGIDGADYFNGTIECPADEFDSQLTATLIIYRTNDTSACINDIVPVWWEFHTFTQEGEQLNDFSFALLKQLIPFD